MERDARRCIATAPLIVSDFDGTLAALEVDWAALRRRLAGEAGRRGWPWETQDGLDANLRRLRREVSEAAFLGLCDIVAAAEEQGFREASVNRTLVDMLRRRGGRPLALCSANTHAALAGLMRRPCFEGLHPFIVGKEDVTKGKPDPEGLYQACRHFGMVPSQGTFLGDTDRDRQAAAAAGFHTFIHLRSTDACTFQRIDPGHAGPTVRS